MTAPRLTLLVIMSLLVAMTTVQAADVTSELQELYDTGKLDQAIEKAQQMLERKKRSADLRYFIGTCYEKKLDFDKAEEFYLEALDRSSGHLPTLYRLGKLLVKDSTRLEEAKGYFDEGLKRAKEDHEKAMFEDGLGLYFLAKGEYSQADRKFRTAEYLDPANCDYKMHLGDANYEKGALTLALTSYTDVLNECDSLNPEVHFRIGVANVKQKRYNEALKDFANAIRLDSAYVQAYQYYGKINILAALASEDQQGALDLYRSAYWSFRKQIEFGYDVPEAYYYLAKVYSALGHSDSAATYFQNAVDAGYDRSDLYSDLGKSYSKAGDYSKAIQVLTEYIDGVLAEDPSHEWTADDVELFLAVARAYAGLDSCELRHEAADYFRQAWELDSTDVTVLTEWAFNYYYMGKCDSTAYEEGLPILYRKLERDTMDVRTLKNISFFFMRMKNWDSTAVYLERVVQIDSTDCSVNKMLASSLSQQKKYAESRKYYAMWGECDSTTYEADKWIGFTYLISQPPDGKNALPYLIKAYEKMKSLGVTECEDNDVVTWIAQAYALDKKYDQSMDWIKKGLKCEPGSKTLSDLKASVQEALDAY